MAGANGNAPIDVDIDEAVFQSVADLEKEFAKVELDALRRKEFTLRTLYTRRNVLTSRIPDFWPAVLMNGPQEFQSTINDVDAEPVAAIKSLNIERYEIKSETEGEPRSLRFTFEFDENEWFEDKTIVKDFQFVEDEDGTGNLVSKPITFKWKKKGKKSNNGFLDLAVDLYEAEKAVRLKDNKTGQDLKVVDRESLWQYEKLREKLAAAEEKDDFVESSWLDWFGYRGPVANARDEKAGKGEDDDDDEDQMEENNNLLDVEVFPTGEEVAIALAEDLWPNAMDYFMASQQEMFPDDEGDEDEDEDEEFAGLDAVEISDDDDEDEEAPELVEVEDQRPAKRQKKA